MSVIAVQNLTFCYDGSYDAVFSNVSFSIDTDWRLGFVGRNGRGKTTLLRLFMGEYAYQGSIRASTSFDYFPFPVANPERPVLELLEELAGFPESWRMERELSLLEVAESAWQRPFSTLSHGEQAKALLSGLFLRENRFLLIDEPTNHLDLAGRSTVCRYLAKKPGFLLVSHDRAFLDGCTDHTLAINRTGIEVTRGSFSAWWENKQRQDGYEQAENQRLSGEIQRLSQAAQQTANWSGRVEHSKIGQHAGDRGYIGAKSAKLMKRAKAVQRRRQAAIEEKSGLLKNLEYASDLCLHPLPCRWNRVAQLQSVGMAYGEHPVFSEVNLTIEPGERVALLGKNGCGKSSLIRLLAGEAAPCAGKVLLPSGLQISYMPQDTSFLRGDLTSYAQQEGIDESLLKTILRKLDFPRVQFEKDMACFSAGQRKKVLLAKSLCQPAHLYLWDEPLNYVDLLSRIQLETMLAKSHATMVFVEHDRSFVDSVSTRQVELT